MRSPRDCRPIFCASGPIFALAERRLAAQTARIGVATADLYPQFSLGGFLGLQATSLGDLFSSDSVNWSIGLPIRWKLFAGGAVRSQIAAEEARTEQLLANYERAVLLALEEVEDAMVSYEKEVARRARLSESVDATERSLDLVLTQYRAGLTDFQNVLDTQRTLLLRQDEFAASEGIVIKALVDLYRALGGGWDPETAAQSNATGAGRRDRGRDGRPGRGRGGGVTRTETVARVGCPVAPRAATSVTADAKGAKVNASSLLIYPCILRAFAIRCRSGQHNPDVRRCSYFGLSVLWQCGCPPGRRS